MQEYFQHPIIRAEYQAFVRNALAMDKKSMQNVKLKTFNAVGLLQDWALREFQERGNEGKTGLVLIDHYLLHNKNNRHMKYQDIQGLQIEEWYELPNWFQSYDVVTWDNDYESLIYWKKAESGWYMIAVGVGEDSPSFRTLRANVDIVETAMRWVEDDLTAILEERQKNARKPGRRDIIIKQ